MYVLLEPVAAERQITRIMDAADSLDHMPLRYRLYEHEPWHSRGLRVFHVNNYLVLYLPDESTHIVTVIRVIYGGRDIQTHLNDMEEQK